MARTGRPRAFDEDDAVARARDLFWSRGYGATSVQDLVDGLELQRGSLYGAFGDKRALYLRALDRYVRDGRAALQALVEAEPVLPALWRMLLDPSSYTGTLGQGRGCLVGNTTAELLPDDEDLRAAVAAAYDGFLEVVAAALRRAQQRGEVTDAATPEAQAQLLLVLFQGGALVARADAGDRERVAAGIEAALDALRAP